MNECLMFLAIPFPDSGGTRGMLHAEVAIRFMGIGGRRFKCSPFPLQVEELIEIIQLIQYGIPRV